MQLTEMNEVYWERRRLEMAAEYPGARLGLMSDLTAEAVDAFEQALHARSEEAIQQVMTAHPYLLQYAIPESGHHGVWAFPKQTIRTRTAAGIAGMIPDFLIVTRSSLGDWWHVVELKRFDQAFSAVSGDGFSPEGQKAVSQCAGYLNHFREYLDATRVNAGISGLTQPTSAIILMGDGETETDAQRTHRSNFVRTSPLMDVVSYRRILLAARADVAFRTSRRKSDASGREDGPNAQDRAAE